MASVSIYGRGQLGTAVSNLLSMNRRYDVRGPFGRNDREEALSSRADVIVIATTTRLEEVAPDIELAIRSGSNVMISAEEAAFPFIVDSDLANRLDRLARERGVTIAGVGVNPGFVFDALVLTLLGAAPRGCAINVRRVVDISGFGSVVLRRIGVGHSGPAFTDAVANGAILGHAGFPQSMATVGSALGMNIERIEKSLAPVISDVEIDLDGRFTVQEGESAGVDQTYIAIVSGSPWFTCHFYGHVALTNLGLEPTDEIALMHAGRLHQSVKLSPGVSAQVGSQNMMANSVERLIAARPGWVTVAELPPAFPKPPTDR